MTEAPLLSVQSVSKAFPFPRGLYQRLTGQPVQAVHALNGVSLEVMRGETLGIVGESGCGKSTLARCLVRLHDCDAGRVLHDQTDISTLQGADRRAFNARVQMIFQDPYSSLNPRMRVRQILSEALSVDADALALPAREFVGVFLGRIGRQANEVEEFRDPGGNLGLGAHGMDGQGFRQDLAHAHPGVQ